METKSISITFQRNLFNKVIFDLFKLHKIAECDPEFLKSSKMTLSAANVATLIINGLKVKCSSWRSFETITDCREERGARNFRGNRSCLTRSNFRKTGCFRSVLRDEGGGGGNRNETKRKKRGRQARELLEESCTLGVIIL